MGRLRIASLLTLASWCGGTFTSPAHADAVEPPPEDCPEGTVGVTGHGGPYCAKDAPTDCPPGYQGVVGGTCVFAPCKSDANCPEDQHCKQVQTCQEYRELSWTGWGWSSAAPRFVRNNWLAGPPEPPPPGPPKEDWVTFFICSAERPCESPAECRDQLLCYPKKVQPASEYRPAHSVGEADPYVDSKDRPSGCGRGCTVRGAPMTASLLFSSSLLLTWAARRGTHRAGL